jgi:hypothetical protein
MWDSKTGKDKWLYFEGTKYLKTIKIFEAKLSMMVVVVVVVMMMLMMI